jgi:hypothetical protein
MLSAVTLPDSLTAAVRLSQALPRYGDATPAKTPPVEPPPPKVQLNRSADQPVQPCFQFSPHRISIAWRLVLGFNAIHEQPQRLAQQLQRPHLCAVSITITQCDAPAFERHALPARAAACAVPAVSLGSALSSLCGYLGVCCECVCFAMDCCCAHVFVRRMLCGMHRSIAASEDGMQNASCLSCHALLTGVLTDPAFGWPLCGLPLVCLGAVGACVSATTVSFGLSVIVTSALRWAFGLLHIQPFPIHGPSVLPWISSIEPFRWHPSYTPALFLSPQVPDFIGRCDHQMEIIANEMI